MEHAVDVQTFSSRGEVRVGGYRDTDIGEDLLMVRPCWIGDVDGWLRTISRRVEFGKEESTEV